MVTIMRITADTITDEQIVFAWNTIPPEKRSIADAITAMHARGLAAGPCMQPPTSDQVRAARERSAEILNERAELEVLEDEDADGVYADGAEPDSDETLGLRR